MKSFGQRRFGVAVFVVAMGLLGVAGCAPGENGGGGGGNDGAVASGADGSGADAGPGTPPGSGGGSCCLNGQYYQCATADAFQRCAGPDVGACFSMCAPGDFDCLMRCDQLAGMAMHDPSQCTRMEARDGSCTTTGGGSCTESSTARTCDIDSDCQSSSMHCTGGRCYANQTGSLCTIDADCGSGNHCTSGCCYDDRSGVPCDIDSDCGSGSSCVSGTCN